MQTDYRVTVSESLEGTDWDDFVASTPGGHHVQTSCWARVKATSGWQAARVSVEEGGRIIAGAQLLFRRVPLVGSIGYVTKGPIVPTADPELAIVILENVVKLARSHQCQMLAIQPPNTGDYLSHILETKGFRTDAMELSPTASLVIELDRGLELVKEGLTRETRRNIGRSERAGIVVREGNSTDLDTFYTLHRATAKRQGFLPYQRNYFDALWEAFSPRGWVALLLASYEEEIVSAQLLIPFGDLVMAKMVGWGGRHDKRYPNYALLWASVVWAASRGYRYFDFEGLNLQEARRRLNGEAVSGSGPDAFKYGFGGKIQLYPSAYVYLPNKMFDWLYRWIPIDKGENGRLVELLRKRG